jgi:hypothetical protein
MKGVTTKMKRTIRMTMLALSISTVLCAVVGCTAVPVAKDNTVQGTVAGIAGSLAPGGTAETSIGLTNKIPIYMEHLINSTGGSVGLAIGLITAIIGIIRVACEAIRALRDVAMLGK